MIFFFQILKKLYDAGGEDNEFEAHVSFGLDGCGSHAKYNGPSYFNTGIDTGNLIFSGFSFTKITKDDKTIHKQENMASAENVTPLFLIDGKETRPLLREMVETLEEEAKYFKDHPVHLIFEDKIFTIWVKLALTQLDGKAVKMLQGRSSAFCLLCSATRKDAHDVQKIREGFPMDICTEDINERYERFKTTRESDEDPEKEAKGEYRLEFKKIAVEVRLGVTHKPMVQYFEVANCIPPLHCRLRGHGWASDILMRFDSDKKTYYKRIDPDIEKKFEQVKKNYRERSRILLGRMMYTPSSGGGTTDNGNTARIFFSHDKRDKVLKMMEEIQEPAENADEDEHEEYSRKVQEKQDFQVAFKKLLQNMSVILNIINSDRLVKIEEYAEFCTNTALMVREKFPWVQFSPTVHEFLAHSAQIIRDNNGRGLLAFSEEGSEATHKLIKNLREKGARKMSLNRNLWDVMKKLWIGTDLSFRRFKRTLTCSHCHVSGHSVRSCPLKQQKQKNEDDLLFDQLTYDDE